ncbi:MAG TPA: chemotaxis protein CheW [Polyangiaceae bacterium]|nr:chemotaxis protein CheW [Polyangiaceae bacterium]
MDDELVDVLREFLEESSEGLDQVDVDLVALEQTPDAPEIVSRIFRTLHSIKGTCGFLGFAKLEKLAHAGESLLSALRDRTLAMTPAIASALLRTMDGIREMLAHIQATRAEGPGDYAALIAQLHDLRQAKPATAPAATPAVPATAPAAPSPAAASPDAPAPPPEKLDTSIRVDVTLLDQLMNLVGELVLSRNQILQFDGPSHDASFMGAKQRLSAITTELQQGVMQTRMQPIGNVWHKFPRVVRDLAAACEKRVRLELEGEQTELDKSLVEAIKDPLTHLVRNAVDHGIEAPSARLAAHKPAEGCLRLRAFHEGGQVHIEVSDDGAGLDAERIRQKAVERAIASTERAARMSDAELFQLIFLPGFSTAAKVTNVSGRGVGMDVVRTNIEKIGGSIELSSRRGVGTTLSIQIPLTLAILRGVVVSSGANRYVVPQASVLELIRLKDADARGSVENLHGAAVYRLRGKLLPLVRLAEVLGEAVAPAAGDVSIAVLEAEGQRFGLIVDAVHDTQEIVVKPLGRHVKSTGVFAGATILGDGFVVLILDVFGLAQRARVLDEADPRARADSAPEPSASGPRQTLLLVRSPGDGRVAIALDRVERLEVLQPARIERTGREQLVQYRGGIMPLIDLRSVLLERRARSRLEGADAKAPPPASDAQPVVVCAHAGGSVGIAVEQIIDIVEEALGPARPPGRPGVLGSVVLAGRITELLDVDAVLRCAAPGAPSLVPAASSPAHADREVLGHGAR